MKIKYDVDTNLPELPNDLFWRVEEGDYYEWYGQEDPRISIIRNKSRKFLWWSWVTPVATGHYAFIKGGLSKTSIQAAAELAYNKRQTWIAEEESKSLLGDYPPKRL